MDISLVTCRLVGKVAFWCACPQCLVILVVRTVAMCILRSGMPARSYLIALIAWLPWLLSDQAAVAIVTLCKLKPGPCNLLEDPLL